MKDRRFKVHFQHTVLHRTMCGLDGTTTRAVNETTCRICMFHYLAGQTTWARGFLDELRGRVGRGQSATVIVPARTPEPMDGKVEGTGHSQACPLSYEGIPQEAIRKLFTEAPAFQAAVKPVVNYGWAPTYAVGVQPRQVTEQPGDAGQVRDESRRYHKFD